MQKYQYYVGIDVSKSTLDVFILSIASLTGTHFVISNDTKGIREIISRLKQEEIDTSTVLFCFENTGNYSLPLCFILSQNKLDYWQITPLEIKPSQGISRGKSDKKDASEIALYALRHIDKLCPGKLPERDLIKLRLLFTEREKILKAIHIFERTGEDEEFFPKEIFLDVAQINQNTVLRLKESLKAVEKKMQEVISENKKLEKQYRLTISVPGVGRQTAIYLLIITQGFTCFKNWRKLACYGGTAPFPYTSGTTIKGRTQVSHLADKKIKSLLTMGAITAIKWDQGIRAYYLRKVQQGKPKKLVINNVRCKLMARVFAVINREQPYVNINKFAA